MTFIGDENVVALLLELEHHDHLALSIAHKLNGHRTRRQLGKDIATESEVLLGLDSANPIRAPFGLNGNDELLPRIADADIQFVRLDLSDIWYGGPQMALK